jgi:hypothetical protein
MKRLERGISCMAESSEWARKPPSLRSTKWATAVTDLTIWLQRDCAPEDVLVTPAIERMHKKCPIEECLCVLELREVNLVRGFGMACKRLDCLGLPVRPMSGR